MKQLPISVWLASIVLFVYSAYGFWRDPVLWLQFLIFVSIFASFVRVVVYLFEGK
jgi:hypothetical protein